MYSLELAHVKDSIKKQCDMCEATNCSETYTDGSSREADQILDAFQVFDHNDTTDVV